MLMIRPRRDAVLFIDLDGFKHINDQQGHLVGDELLGRIARAIEETTRIIDVVGRFGGDEFVALLTDCSDIVAAEVAERLRVSLARPYEVAGREVVVSASIGLARPVAGEDAEDALRNADLALYRAKSGGRDRVAVYEPEDARPAPCAASTEPRLRHALVQDELLVAYQPIVDLRTGEVLRDRGAAALAPRPARWRSPEDRRGREESGLIVTVGAWALAQGRRRPAPPSGASAGCPVDVSVNVSARQLMDTELPCPSSRPRWSAPGCRRTGCASRSPSRCWSPTTRLAYLVLAKLRQLGVRLAIDDFGTGYSGLTYLRRLPVDQIKIDRSLVSRVGGPRDTVPSVLRLGRDLSLSVVAEGVETVEQLVLLRNSGCTLGQGHLFSPALELEAATEVVARGRIELPADAISQGRTFVSDDETGRVTA